MSIISHQLYQTTWERPGLTVVCKRARIMEESNGVMEEN